MFLGSLHLSYGAPRKAPKMDPKLIERMCQQSEAVVVAAVKSVGTPPPAWSGVFAAHQPVQYQVVRWLKEPAPKIQQGTLTVFHPVVAKSLTADPNEPKLLETLFHPGAELILFLRFKDARFESFDENYGAVPSDARTQTAVVEGLKQIHRQPPSQR